MNGAKVYRVDAISKTKVDIEHLIHEVDEKCGSRISEIEALCKRTSDEEKVSLGMLDVAKTVEAVASAKFVAATAKAAKAAAKETAAISSGNPVAITIASAAALDAATKLAKATDEHNKAVKHRQRLEKRYEMAQRCRQLAEKGGEILKSAFNVEMSNIKVTGGEGIVRLMSAHGDLGKYISENKPNISSISFWGTEYRHGSIGSFEEKHRSADKFPKKTKTEHNIGNDAERDEKTPVRPDELNQRLSASEETMRAVLEDMYTSEVSFKAMVDSYRAQASAPGAESAVKLKIKKSIAGRLSEELVKRAFEPLGETVETQSRTVFPDGRYTKTDLIVRKLKSPMILGRGEGMGAREGSDLAIEVKTGHKEYLRAQQEHMRFQTKGHENCNLSCTICSRDIKNLGAAEPQLREAMKEAGSPIIGMLPYKDEIDSACIGFVLEDCENV